MGTKSKTKITPVGGARKGTKLRGAGHAVESATPRKFEQPQTPKWFPPTRIGGVPTPAQKEALRLEWFAAMDALSAITLQVSMLHHAQAYGRSADRESTPGPLYAHCIDAIGDWTAYLAGEEWWRLRNPYARPEGWEKRRKRVVSMWSKRQRAEGKLKGADRAILHAAGLLNIADVEELFGFVIRGLAGAWPSRQKEIWDAASKRKGATARLKLAADILRRVALPMTRLEDEPPQYREALRKHRLEIKKRNAPGDRSPAAVAKDRQLKPRGAIIKFFEALGLEPPGELSR